MNIKSMTGFGKAEATDDKRKITVEIKTLNSKSADLTVKVPNVLKDREMDIRNMLTTSLQRGKIEINVTVEEKMLTCPSRFDEGAVVGYFTQLKDIAERHKMPFPEDILNSIIRLPDVLKTVQETADESETLLLERCVADALKRVNMFRTQEGEALAKDITARIKMIENLIINVEEFEQQRLETIKTRLSQNLVEYIGENTIDQNRFEQELIYYLEKLDITEEKVRLRNHCSYFIATMNEDGAGKKLGFVAQEIGREVNTLGSKANHAEIQQIVIRMKDELEKVKEQILNIL